MVSSVNRISVNKESTGERMPIQKKEHSCNWVENSTEKSKVKMSGIRQTFRPQIWVNTKWSISDDKTLFLLDTWVTPCFHICYLELYRHMYMCICIYTYIHCEPICQYEWQRGVVWRGYTLDILWKYTHFTVTNLRILQKNRSIIILMSVQILEGLMTALALAYRESIYGICKGFAIAESLVFNRGNPL